MQYFDLITPKDFKVKRESSYDRTGFNFDFAQFEKDQSRVIADLEGPGVISHIWFTVGTFEKNYLRKIVLKIYWDDETEPSILSPIGDFFGLGHAQPYTYQCAIFNTSSNDGGLGVAMNCWLPMPFKKRARIVIDSEMQEMGFNLYYYIDYQKHDSLPDDIYYLHAQWRRENPTKVPEDNGVTVIRKEDWKDSINLTEEYNYLILDAEGEGNYIGVNFSIGHDNIWWWGEGDDMFFIDRDGERQWPPDLHGTGSEDYLCHAWGMQHAAHLYSGESWWDDRKVPGNGKTCVYRYHILDPIPFKKNIHVSIEHGHANDQANDWASVAYWYQNEPHKVFLPILPVEKRMPCGDE